MKFLLIDDDEEDATIFCEALNDIDAGIICDYEPDPLLAISRVSDTDTKTDLIFLDLNMPVMDGWEVLNLFKDNHHIKSIPVIIYSTSPLERDISKAKTMGAAFYFAKPMDFIELREQLQRIVTAFEEQKLDQVKLSR